MAGLIAELSIVAPNALGCAVDARAPRTLFDVANASAAFAFVWLARQFCDCCQNGTDVTDMDMADRFYRVSLIRPLGKYVKFYANGHDGSWDHVNQFTVPPTEQSSTFSGRVESSGPTACRSTSWRATTSSRPTSARGGP